MRRNHILRTSVALAAVTALLGACSESSADPDDKADERLSTSSPTPTDESSVPTEETELPDGVLPLPASDGGEAASLGAGRYRIPLTDTLAFEVDVPDNTSAHDNGTFLATADFVLKTEAAGGKYGVPRDPCTDQSIDPVGPTVDDLVQAITDLPIYEMTRPEPTELGGATGTYVETRIPRTYDASQCEGGAVQLPANPTTVVSGPPPYIGRWWILDVDGQRVVVQQNCWGCPVDHLNRPARMARSITFAPTT